MWCPKPSQIIVQADGGSANMGSLPTYAGPPTGEYSTARFKLETDIWCLVFARVHFSGGTGTATLSLYIDSRLGSRHDTNLWSWTSAGTTGNDVNFRIVPDELMHWAFRKDDELVFTWTNPDTGNMLWAIEVGLADATHA